MLGSTSCTCGVDFNSIPSHHCHIHHIDHNHTNQEFSNLVLLCMPCHQKHHKVGNTYVKNKVFIELRKFSPDETSDICEAYSTTLFTFAEIAEATKSNKKTIAKIINSWDSEITKRVVSTQRQNRAKTYTRSEANGRF